MVQVLDVLKLFADAQLITKLSDEKPGFLSVRQVTIKLKEDNFLYIDEMLSGLYYEEMLERDTTSLLRYKLSAKGVDLLKELKVAAIE